MFLAFAGLGIGAPGVESLFLTRFGVQYLPYMYVALGAVTVAITILIGTVFGRMSRRSLYQGMPLVLLLWLITARLLIGLGLRWAYPPVFLSMYVMWTLQNLFTWGTASLVFDARQAKRLFPLFAAAGILGRALGGLSTRIWVDLIGTENLLFVWAGALLLAAAGVLAVARARKAYTAALAEALRAGGPAVFFPEEQPFVGRRRDASAVSAVLAGAGSPEPQVRRVSTEILGHLGVPRGQEALLRALGDPDSGVRASALRSLGRSGAAAAAATAPALGSLLRDPSPEVRRQAAEELGRLAPLPGQLRALLLPLLEDREPEIRAAAASALLRSGEDAGALGVLQELARAERVEHRVLALQGLAGSGGEEGEEMYVILSGEVSVVTGQGSRPRTELARRRAGEHIGEMSLLSGAPRMATMVAVGEVHALGMARREFEQILRQRPDTSLVVMKVLCDRLREAQSREPLSAQAANC
jgi:CRP-like cAMP-binding protein